MNKFVFLTLSAALFVASPVYGASGVSDRTLKKVHVNVGSGIYFQTDQAMINPDGCNGTAWYHVRPGTSYEKEVLSILLSAEMANKKITFYLNGCIDGYPAVDWVNVHS